MTHLRIELNNIQENVSSAVIEKLYELATSGDLDLSSNLAGNLHTTATYLEYIDAIRAEYPDLTISSDNIFIWFQDPEVLHVLLANNIGANGGVTMTQALSANIGDIFKNNTTITLFNEFRFFTATTTIAENAFQGCTSLTSITLPSTCNTISALAFVGCTNLTSLDLSNITTIGLWSFSSSGIRRLVLPKVTSIPDWAFSNSDNFTYIEFGENLTSIGTLAFWGSRNLRTLVFRSTVPPTMSTVNVNRFLYDMSNLTIYVPDASLTDYLTAWSPMVNNITGISNLPQS